MSIDYNHRKFRVIAQSGEGDIEPGLVFHYRQNGNILSCEYEGGDVRSGHLLGLVEADGKLRFSYHQINHKGELRTGVCTSVPERLEDGRLRLHEQWEWTDGNPSSGTSVLEEILAE